MATKRGMFQITYQYSAQNGCALIDALAITNKIFHDVGHSVVVNALLYSSRD